MFTVHDSVENDGAEPVSLRPYALILRRGKPNVAGYAVLHEGFVGVIGDGSVQEITYPNIEKETGRIRELKGDGGWLGFTDKYWGSAIIPDQTEPIDARFSRERNGAAGGLPDRLRRPGDRRRARRDRRRPRRGCSPARRKWRRSTPTRKNLGIKKFDLMIDWGWFYFITKPLFRLIDFDLPLHRRQFRHRHPHRHLADQARLLPARQPELPLDGEDEEDPAADRRAEGPLSRRPRQAAAGADGAVQQGRRQSGRRLPADGDPDPGVLRALQGDLHHHRDAARAVLRLDQGSFRARPDQYLHAVRAHPVGPDGAADVRPLPPSRHLAADHGRLDVPADEDEPRAGRPGAEDRCSPGCR